MNLRILLVAIFSFPIFSHALEVSQEALIRDDNFKPIITKVILQDLTAADQFDGKYFKIVKGKSDDAISMQDDDLTVLKAATTYYHLTKARNYFVGKLHSEYVKNLPQMVIRIDITNTYNELGHFANDRYPPIYNTAKSFPAGRGYPARNILPWGNEIWFRPSKKVHVSELPGGEMENAQLKNVFRQFRNRSHVVSLDKFMAELLVEGVDKISEDPLDSFFRVAGSSLVIELIFQSTDRFVSLFEKNWYYLDAAMVPEIIYHEYSHIALSDKIAISHSSPINEGLGDYFASQMANSKKLYGNIKEYNQFIAKKVRKRNPYQLQFENVDFANTDFVFALIYKAVQIMDQKNGAAIIYDMRNYLNTDETIKEQLIDALINACTRFCVNPFPTKLKLYQLFQSHGL